MEMPLEIQSSKKEEVKDELLDQLQNGKITTYEYNDRLYNQLSKGIISIDEYESRIK